MDSLGQRNYVNTLKESGEYESAKENREAEVFVKKESPLKPLGTNYKKNK